MDATRNGAQNAACAVLRARVAFTEKDFYLDEFRGRTLVLAADRGALQAATARRRLRAVVGELTAHGSRELVVAGEAEFLGLSHRRAMLGEIDGALEGGVGSVNLCKVDGLSRELFTYEGAGTLFTRDDYCRVEHLAIDDFHEVERLVARGQREGLLKPRAGGEIAHLLLGGFGAWIGRQNLAGIGALHVTPYTADSAGEIAGLYTMTRFKGERIGRRLVRRLVAEARAMHLRYVFAVTANDEAARFFR